MAFFLCVDVLLSNLRFLLVFNDLLQFILFTAGSINRLISFFNLMPLTILRKRIE